MINFDNNRMQDISLAEKGLLNQYKQLWQAQDWQGVATFLNNNPELKYKIFDSYNWNRIKNTLNSDNAVEIDYDYRDGDSSLNFDFVDEMSTSIPQEIMADAQSISENSVNFAYTGQWSSGTTYSPNNLVTIDDYHLFYCIQQHEASNSNKPTNTEGNSYWVLCKGFLGNLGTDGLIVDESQPSSLTNGDLWIQEVADTYSTLLDGSSFRSAISSLVTNLGNIRKVIFTRDISIPNVSTAIVSISGEETPITAYWDSALNTLTISSANAIRANANCSEMFYLWNGCSEFDFSNFDTSLTTNMSLMFEFCSSSSLTTIDLSNFDTSNVTTMSGMFSGCYYLEQLDLSNFDTSNVTDMSSMFGQCYHLTNINLSSFNTSNVTTMLGMFRDCFSLISIDLSSFNTSNVGTMTSMFNLTGQNPFSLIHSLQTIYVGANWVCIAGSTMFSGCSHLVGTGIDGRTWAYNSSYTDYRSAKVGNSSTTIPAYLTLKTNQGE